MLDGTPEEIRRIVQMEVDGDVVVLERDVYLDLMRESTRGTAAWDATADALDLALRCIVDVPDGYAVTWWMPRGQSAPRYGFRVGPEHKTPGLLFSLSNPDPAKALRAMFGWLQEQGAARAGC